MHTHTKTALLSVIALAAAPVALAQDVTFEMILGALSANDMSPDGRWIVGERDIDGNGFPDGTYRLDRETGTYTFLPFIGHDAVGISDDGQMIVGDIDNPEGDGSEVAARWTEATGWQSLGYLPGAFQCPSRSNAYEISADGSVVVGLSWEGCDGMGFRWTQLGGMVPLESLANGTNRASICSSDGNVIGGFAQGSFSRTPVWWAGNGDGTLLDPPEGDALGEVYGLSDDGEILLGSYDQDPIKVLVGEGEIEIVGGGGLLPGWTGVAMDIADNGTIVGFDYLQLNRRGWIQPNGEGPVVDLNLWIPDNGGTIPTGLIVEVPQAISTDGTVFVGHGLGTGAWIVTIDTPCDGDTNDDGVINVNDLNNVILDWGTDGSANGGDITGPIPGSPPDGVVNVNDLNAVIVNWGVCP